MSEISIDKEPIEMPHPDSVPDGVISGSYITQVPLTEEEEMLEEELLQHFGRQGCHTCND